LGSATDGGLGNGITRNVMTPIATSQGFTNGALVTSQASVLIQKFSAAAGATISGHVMPIAYTMANNTTGKQALLVTYDPLAAAAAMFIDQYAAHLAACNATTTEAMTELEQQAGTRLWACSNPTAKASYLSGMTTLLAGARSYLFGRPDGSATAACPGAAATPASCVDATAAHFPYTFVVPNYVDVANNPEYYGQLDTALASYRQAVLAGTTTSALHKALQLAGIAKFDSDSSAIVTTRVKRSGVYGAGCADTPAAAVAAAPTLGVSALTLPASLPAGASASVTVTLSSPAPAGGRSSRSQATTSLRMFPQPSPCPQGALPRASRLEPRRLPE
jgi:hypothetical protein